ncbi:MAG TPA: AAA family ATPase [Woeseiaceae bacterium]|nr:AAA family ATPase [Woeseiaceae bacterium]
MYLSFFGLNDKPFAITPDPRYLFMSERHGEGLAHLVYGVTESGGFIQLTGEVGTGKTTLVRTLLGQLPDEVDVALILNPQLNALEFLLAICEELGVTLPADTGSSKALVDALNRHLLAAHAGGRRTILLVDEAQNLAAEVLEQVRLLTNLETAKQKLLQIILIGQPELRDLLAQNRLRQLAQRVTGRYHLEPLSKDEALHYIEHRMKVAGALTDVFDAAAKRAVYRVSGGIPRIMNVVCDRALLGAYSRGTRQVTRAIVLRAAREVSGDTTSRTLKLALVAAAAVAAAVIGAGLWMSLDPSPGPGPADGRPVVSRPLALSTAPAEDGAGGTGPVQPAVPATAAAVSPALGELLLRDPPASDVESAMQTLLGLWGIDYDPAAGTGCAQAAAAGLRCLFQRGSLAVIRRLNRPAMLTLTDSAGDNHSPVLTAIDGDTVELVFGSTSLHVPERQLADLWFGQYVLLWRPPPGAAGAIRPGSRGENVRWLRQSLATLDGIDADDESPDYFDAGLERRLMAFQRRHRLQVDGLAGQQTLILINSLLADDGTPLLAAKQP